MQATMWNSKYHSMDSRFSKWYRELQECHSDESAYFRRWARKSGWMRWATIKLLIEEGFLAADYVDYAAYH